MLFDRKYQDIDTGKFDTDKIHSLNSCTIGEIFSSCSLQNMAYEYEPTLTNEAPRDMEKIKAYDDIRKEKKISAQEERTKRALERNEKTANKIRESLKKKNAARKEEAERRKIVERDHALWLDEENARKQREQEQKEKDLGERLIYLNGQNAGQVVTNVRPNNFVNWRYVGTK